MSFVRPTHTLCTGRGTHNLPSKLSIVIFHCFTRKHNKEHQFTVACYVSNIIRAFILRYLYKVRLFRAQVLDNTTSSTGLRWPAVFSRNIRAWRISMAVLDIFIPQQGKHPSLATEWHSKRLKIRSAIQTITYHCRMNGSISVIISWGLYDCWEIVKKLRAFRV